MNQKSMDIMLTCALGLEGGLQKYAHLVPELPTSTIDFVYTMDFIHEWNGALMSVLNTPRYKQHLGRAGRALLALKSPKLTAWTVDKIAVPYRSFYYAYRFASAYKHISNGATENSLVLDYGNGFSPLLPMMMLNEGVAGCGMDAPMTQEIVDKTCGIMEIKAPKLLDNDCFEYVYKDFSAYCRHGFVSLGTFAYMPGSVQYRTMQNGLCYPHVYIEVDGAPNADARLVEKVGAKYEGAWNRDTLNAMLFGEGVSIKTLSERAIFAKHDKLRRAINKANELFIVR